MLSKILGDKVCIAKAWRNSARDVCKNHLLVSDSLPFLILVEIGGFNNAIIKDDIIAELYAEAIENLILGKGWETLPIEEVAACVQLCHDSEPEDVQEQLGASEVSLIQHQIAHGNVISRPKRVLVPV